MAVVCAYCLGVLTTGEPFLFAGTEVFHRECVKEHGTTESVGNKQRRQLAQLEQRQAQTQTTINRLEAAVAERDRTLATRTQQVQQLRDELDDANLARTVMAEQIQELVRERTQLTSERDKARQDLALAQLPPARPKMHDPRDDTEIRFSLLEIDEPPPK